MNTLNKTDIVILIRTNNENKDIYTLHMLARKLNISDRELEDLFLNHFMYRRNQTLAIEVPCEVNILTVESLNMLKHNRKNYRLSVINKHFGTKITIVFDEVVI